MMVPEDTAPAAAEGVRPPLVVLEPAAVGKSPVAEAEVDAFRCRVDDLVSKTDVLEKRVHEVEGFYDVKKHGSGGRKVGGSSRYGAYSGKEGGQCKGMPDLMRQFGAIIHQEKKQKEEESNDVPTTNTSREAVIAKLAKDTDNELNEINKQLEELRNMVVQRCRKMTTDEKRKLGAGLCHLSPEDLNKALEMVAQDNPSFQTTAAEVDLDMDAQSETTLWGLKLFVREALERQANVASDKTDENAKRKREISNALAKTASKRIKKQP